MPPKSSTQYGFVDETRLAERAPSAPDGSSLRLNALEARVTALESFKKENETEAIAALKATIKKYEDGQTHWTRYAATVLFSLVTGAILMLIGRMIAKH